MSKPRQQPAPARKKTSTNGRPDRTANQMRQALELWQAWLAEAQWHQLDRWLKHTLGKNRKYGKRDRLFYGDVLFNATRFGYLAGCILRHGDDKPQDAIAQFATQASNAARLKQTLQQIAKSAKGADFLALCQWLANRGQKLPRELHEYTGAIQKLEKYAQEADDGFLVWHGTPVNYLPQIQALSSVYNHSIYDNSIYTKGADQKFIQAQAERPPLWLRLNHENKRHEVLTELEEFYELRDLDGAIAITGQRGIFGLECYKKGWVEVQDWASQQLAKRVAAVPGDKVWDACAGGGGKTQAIASKLNNKGSVWATDIREHKLNEVKRRAKLAGFFNIRTAPWNGEAALKLPKEIANDGGFDWVLVDGPCSSSGTWRRNPDAKLRNLGEELTELTTLQLQLLSNASQCVKPQGRLVYGTCSFFEEENQQVIERFLENNEGWTLESSELLGCPSEDSDTLFAAVLRKS